MNRRKYVYVAAGVIILVVLGICAIVIINKNNSDKANGVSTSQNENKKNGDQSNAVGSGDIKTPTDNTELTNTLNDDAASIDTDLKNYENDDYKDSNLTDSSLYN